MSYHEPQYLELDEHEDFKLDAHVEADGWQRFEVTGYLVRRRNGQTWRTPLIPEMFYGVNGEQLDTWRQYLTAGDHTIIRRDSGNPYVPDGDLHWQLVGGMPRQQRLPSQTTVTYEIPVVPIVAGVLVLFGLIVVYKLAK